MNRNVWTGLPIGLAMLLGACGSPELRVPQALQVVYLPLDGAQDVALDVEVTIYFSDELDTASVHDASVKLESADAQSGGCPSAWADASVWTGTDWDPAVGTDPRTVTLKDNTDLSPGKCYRIVCTTEVRGVEQGPLLDLSAPEQSGIGAVAVFQTRPD